MKIILIRHFSVKAKFNLFCSSKQFDQQMKMYDLAEVTPIKINLEGIKPDAVYCSNLKRAKITAQSKYPDQFIISELIKEVPLSSILNTKIKIPPLFWLFLGRIMWFFNSKKQKEKRWESNIRAESFLRENCLPFKDENKTIILFTHGFFMGVLKRTLKSKGFKTKGFFIARHATPYTFTHLPRPSPQAKKV